MPYYRVTSSGLVRTSSYRVRADGLARISEEVPAETAPVTPPAPIDFATRAALLAGDVLSGSTTTEGSYYGDTGAGGSAGYAEAVTYNVTERASPMADDWGTVLVLDADLSTERTATIGDWDGQIGTLGTNPDGSPEQIVLRTVRCDVTFENGKVITLPAGYLHGIAYHAEDKGGGVIPVVSPTGKVRLHASQTPHGLPDQIVVHYKVSTSKRRLERADLYALATGTPLLATPTVEAQCFGIRPYVDGVVSMTGNHDNAAPVNWGLRAMEGYRDRAEGAGLSNVICTLKVAGGLPADWEILTVEDWYPDPASTPSGTIQSPASLTQAAGVNRDLDVLQVTGGVRYGYLGTIGGMRGVRLAMDSCEFRQMPDADGVGTHPEAFPSATAASVFVHLGSQHAVAQAVDSPLGDGTYRDAATVTLNATKDPLDSRYIDCDAPWLAVCTGTMWHPQRNESEGRYRGCVIEPNLMGNRGFMEPEAGGASQWEFNDWKLQLQDNSKYGGVQMAKNAETGWYPLGAKLYIEDGLIVNSTGGKCLLVNHPDVECMRDGPVGLGGSVVDHGAYAPCGYAEHTTFRGYGGRGGYVFSSEQVDEFVIAGLAPNPANRPASTLMKRGEPVLEYRLAGDYPNQAAITAAVIAGGGPDVAAQGSVRSNNTLAPYPGSNVTLRYADLRAAGPNKQKETNDLMRYTGSRTVLVGDADGAGGKAKVFGCTNRLTQLLGGNTGDYDAAWEACDIGNLRVIVGNGETPPQLCRAPRLDGDSRMRDIVYEIQAGATPSLSNIFAELMGSDIAVDYTTVFENIDASAVSFQRALRIYLDRDCTYRFVDCDLPIVPLSSTSQGFALNGALSPTDAGPTDVAVEISGGSADIPTSEYSGGWVAGTVGALCVTLTGTTIR